MLQCIVPFERVDVLVHEAPTPSQSRSISSGTAKIHLSFFPVILGEQNPYHGTGVRTAASADGVLMNGKPSADGVPAAGKNSRRSEVARTIRESWQAPCCLISHADFRFQTKRASNWFARSCAAAPRAARSPRVARKASSRLREPTVCRGCGASFLRRVWRKRALTAALFDEAAWGSCPACEQIGRGEYYGRVLITAADILDRDAVERRIRNVARRAGHTQPERRIVSIDWNGLRLRGAHHVAEARAPNRLRARQGLRRPQLASLVERRREPDSRLAPRGARRVIALPLLVLLVADIGSPLPRVAAINKGRALYMSQCSRCHGANGIGDGPDAPLLRNPPADLRRSEVLDAFSDEKLAERIREGKVMRLEFRPESISRQAADTEALYRFLQKLPETRWKSVDAGAELYFERCTPCHGGYGHPESALPPGVTRRPQDLSDEVFQASVSDRELRWLVRHGRRGMPVVLPRLTEAEAADLVSFVRLLSPGFELYDSFCSTCHGFRGEGATERCSAPSRAALRLRRPLFSHPHRATRSAKRSGTCSRTRPRACLTSPRR